MMKFIIFSCLLALAAAAPPPAGAKASVDAKIIPIVSYQNAISHDGVYEYKFESGDGTKVQESGQPDGESFKVSGSFSFVGTDGITYSVSYTSDENGFAPQGAHLPTPPPIPEDIVKALAYIAAHPEENDLHK